MDKTLDNLTMYDFDDRYMCDKYGIVTNRLTERKLSPFLTRDKYIEYVLITKNKQKKHIQAHRIVAGLYLPLIEGKNYVNHIDGNRQNNHVSNLEWVTQSENIKHSFDVLGKVIWNKGLKTKNKENRTFKLKK